RTYIFGSGGGEQLATELQAPLLGQIPIDSRICSGGDSGNPIATSEQASPASEVFRQIAIALHTTFKTTTKKPS
ncbi:P-loop NTPase, partial [Nostoc piscinale]|uniref:P-loop NTPase n=1 Tax=Nostoc piscinale TaxID=224012 RepID=UPI0039A54E65